MIGRVRAQVAEHELQLELDEPAKEFLVDKGWDPAMGARPLRRAIQRFIEDPLADEVLRTGDIVPGTTVLVERDASSEDDDERPLELKLVKPKKRPPAKKREPVGVGAAAAADGEGSGPKGGGTQDEPTADGSGDGGEPTPAPDEPAEPPAPEDE
jgi:ATP-dependent Clp protease ATP-binding subunit ClpC